MYVLLCLALLCDWFFFFKQKTAYEMRISDWCSDVCSSDLMFDAMARARAGAGVIALPLLIQHGADDRLTAPAGSRFLFDHVGSRDKRLEIYPGLFHEIYNEPERDAALDDLIGWFEGHRTEARRVGKECVSTVIFGWST